MKKKKTNIFDDILWYIREQKEQPTEEDDQEDPNVEDQNMEQDSGQEDVGTEPGMDPNAQDPNAMGGMEPPEETPEETQDRLRRAYRLKKIYTRLLSVSKLLDRYSDQKFYDIKEEILEAIDIFHVFIENFETLKDSIDDITNKFEKFLMDTMLRIEKLI